MNLEWTLFRYLPNILYNKETNYVKQQWFCYKWIKKHIDWAYADVEYDKCFNNSVVPNESIFMYWKQGWDNAPQLVKKCQYYAKQHAGNHPLIFLDETNVHSYVKMPDYIEELHEKGTIKEALYSDMLRICLLEQYGGYWMDATCFLSAPIPQHIDNSDFFMFSNTLLPEWSSPIKGSNWFIHSKLQTSVLSYVKRFLFNYWKHKKYLINYYIFHIALAAIVDSINEVEASFESMPYICNMNPHVLQKSFGKTFEKESYDFILQQCFIHKLTYKYDDKLLNSADENNLTHFLNS